MKKEKITNFLIAAGVSAPVVMLLGCVAISAGVIGDIYVVEEERLLTPAMLTFMDGDLDDVVRRYSSIDRNGHAIGKLNKALLLQWQVQRNNEEEDD